MVYFSVRSGYFLALNDWIESSDRQQRDISYIFKKLWHLNGIEMFKVRSKYFCRKLSMLFFLLGIILQLEELKLIQLVLDVIIFQNTPITCCGIVHGLQMCGSNHPCGRCYPDLKETIFRAMDLGCHE